MHFKKGQSKSKVLTLGLLDCKFYILEVINGRVISIESKNNTKHINIKLKTLLEADGLLDCLGEL